MAAKSDPLPPCIRCSKLPAEGDKFCTDCGAPLQNRCFDEPGLLKKGCKHVNHRTAAYCAKCGGPTMFLMHGLVESTGPMGNVPTIANFMHGR